MNKEHLGTCAKCPKGTNNCPWIAEEDFIKSPLRVLKNSVDKVWLCSKHYRE